ncbi:MAG: hypothetical protein JW904_06445 [Spirochaetales bacterium]|nr:hypothetical protein [Spirochaetales bacterium]
MQKECEHASACRLWSEGIAGSLDHFFILKYCNNSKKRQCARYTLIALRLEVPPELLPNGKHFTNWLQKEKLAF